MVLKSVKVLIATIGLGLGSTAIAEDLVYYDRTLAGTFYYYDAETIRRYSNNTVEVWIKQDASKDKTVPFRTARVKYRLNCSSDTLVLLGFAKYRANGSMMTQFFDLNDVEYVIPGSVGQTLFKILCPSDP